MNASTVNSHANPFLEKKRKKETEDKNIKRQKLHNVTNGAPFHSLSFFGDGGTSKVSVVT